MIEKPGVGAIIQNNLIGPQEARMYDETADTPYTKPAWERVTRGAIEQSEIDFPFLFGSTNKKVIPKRGDMLGNLGSRLDFQFRTVVRQVLISCVLDGLS